jgi:hypothetical protein
MMIAKISDAGLWRIANTAKKKRPTMSKALEYHRIHLINRVSFASVSAIPGADFDILFMVFLAVVKTTH